MSDKSFRETLNAIHAWIQAGAMQRPSRRISRPVAYFLVAGAFVAGFGASVVNSVAILVGESTSSGPSASWWRAIKLIVEYLGVTALLCGMTILAVKLLYRTPPGLQWKGLRKEVGAGSVVWFAAEASLILMMLAGGRGFPVDWEKISGPELTYQLVNLTTAGFAEEPLFTVAIPVLLLASGARFRTALLVSVVLRVAFHAYYGPSVLFLGVWATIAVLVLWRTGCLVGIVIAHCLLNTLHVSAQLLPGAWSLLPRFLIGAAVITGFVTAIRGAHRFDSEIRTSESAHA